MKPSILILYKIAKYWPAPRSVEERNHIYDESYQLNYALKNQYILKLSQGINFDFYGKSILEIGCGHGGISTLLSIIGAKEVVGIDINKENLGVARKFAEIQTKRLGADHKVVSFKEMSAYEMSFKENTFDVILADNVFEHFMKPDKVLEQSQKVLKSGGRLIVPIFSSIYSKYALHLKTGLKVPWTNLFFSEKTIVRALYRLAEDDPSLFDAYPGLRGIPTTVRDVRKYKDLNDITYKKFRLMAKENGFRVESFKTHAPKGIKLIAAFVRRVPFLRNSIVADIFSTGASAILVKK